MEAARTHLGPLAAMFFCNFACSLGDVESMEEGAGAGQTSGACVLSDKRGGCINGENVVAVRWGRRTTPRFRAASSSNAWGGAGNVIWREEDVRLVTQMWIMKRGKTYLVPPNKHESDAENRAWIGLRGTRRMLRPNIGPIGHVSRGRWGAMGANGIGQSGGHEKCQRRHFFELHRR